MRAELAPGVVLRTLTAADAEAFAASTAGDLARLAELLPWPERTSTPEGATAWLGQFDAGEGGRVLVAGAFEDDALVVGVVLFDHVEATSTIELGCWAVAAAEGRGLVSAACVEALRVARALPVERVVWRCDPRNTRSQALAGRLGFHHEGTLRSSWVLRGERLDSDLFSLVGTEIDVTLERATNLG